MLYIRLKQEDTIRGCLVTAVTRIYFVGIISETEAATPDLQERQPNAKSVAALEKKYRNELCRVTGSGEDDRKTSI